jgi:rubrerythrin
MDSKVASPPLSPLFPLVRTAPPTLEALARRYAELAESRQTIARHEAALHAADLKIQALTLELAHHKRLRFGQTSEALAAAGQRELFEETVAADQAAVEAELEQLLPKTRPKAPRKRRVRAGRQPLPPHLPRIEHRHEPASGQCRA